MPWKPYELVGKLKIGVMWDDGSYLERYWNDLTRIEAIY